MFGFLRRKRHYAIRMEDDDPGLELVENRAIVRRCWYRRGDLSTTLYFHHNCLRIGMVAIPLEYILTMDHTGLHARLRICADIIGNTVVKTDKITVILVKFAIPSDADVFNRKLYAGMLYCKHHGEYDRSVFGLNVVKKFISRIYK